MDNYENGHYNNYNNYNNFNGGLSVALSTILTTWILNHFDINQMMYGPIYSGLDQAMRNFSFEDFKNFNALQYLTLKNLVFCVVAFLIYKHYTKIENCLKKLFFRDTSYLTLNIYNERDIRRFNEYFEFFPKFYDVPKEMEYGNPDLLIRAREYQKGGDIENLSFFKKPADFIDVYFKDTNFNVNGFFTWMKMPIEIKKKDDVQILNIPYIQLNIEDKPEANINEYFEKMEEKVIELMDNQIELYHVKIIKKDEEIYNNEFTTYSGEKRDLEELENLYIKSFFHKERDILWQVIKEINFNPTNFYKFGQAPRIGLLLHGPPGTGKSTFAYRIAMALNRHIISLDLRTIKNKNEIYKIMRRPEINDDWVQPNKVVYIFDEFDLTVRELHAKKNKMTDIYNKWITHVSKQNTKEIMSTEEKNNYKKPKKIKKIKKRNIKNKTIEYTSEEDQEDYEEEQLDEKEEDANTESSEPSRDYNIESFGYDTEDLTLEDLLEIFQGPVPLDGSIIIATTNKYSEILKLCEALFRPGRLTPIHFDYVDEWLLNEMSKYYYNKEFIINKDIKKYKISPSLLVQYATESKIVFNKDPYEYFINKINELLI